MTDAAPSQMISILAPHEGERRTRGGNTAPKERFQSSLPTRGSDKWCAWTRRRPWYFNPRSPRGGATNCSALYFSFCAISILAPHEGERRSTTRKCRCSKAFQSSLPTRGSDALIAFIGRPTTYYFNPRSPRGGATVALCTAHAHRHNFNPRSPRGGATCVFPAPLCPPTKFQSSLPTRGSDNPCSCNLHGTKISILAPHEGERP